MLAYEDLTAVLESIPVRMITRDDWTIAIINEDGEPVRVFNHARSFEAEAFFLSLLTADQIEALQIECDAYNDNQAEAAANRQLSYTA